MKKGTRMYVEFREIVLALKISSVSIEKRILCASILVISTMLWQKSRNSSIYPLRKQKEKL